jgi:predicted RNA-binding protein with PIN domain
MTLLVDGYNVLFVLGFVARRAGPQELEQARRTLLDLLADHLGNRLHQVTVVFDAPRAPRHVAREYTYRGVQVALSPRHQEADDLLEQMIRACNTPMHLAVASSDHRLLHAAQRRGATGLRAEELLAWLEKHKPEAVAEGPAVADKQPELDEEQVQRWLQEFGHLDRDPTLGQPRPFTDQE